MQGGERGWHIWHQVLQHGWLSAGRIQLRWPQSWWCHYPPDCPAYPLWSAMKLSPHCKAIQRGSAGNVRVPGWPEQWCDCRLTGTSRRCPPACIRLPACSVRFFHPWHIQGNLYHGYRWSEWHSVLHHPTCGVYLLHHKTISNHKKPEQRRN